MLRLKDPQISAMDSTTDTSRDIMLKYGGRGITSGFDNGINDTMMNASSAIPDLPEKAPYTDIASTGNKALRPRKRMATKKVTIVTHIRITSWEK